MTIIYKSPHGALEDTGSHLQFRDVNNQIHFTMNSDEGSRAVAIARAKVVSRYVLERSETFIDASAQERSNMLDAIDPVEKASA